MYKILLSPNGKVLRDSNGKILIWAEDAVAFIEESTLVFETGAKIENDVLILDSATVENERESVLGDNK